MNLPSDIINLILREAGNHCCVLVCKQWYKIILDNSNYCVNCNKITTYYNNILLTTDNGDITCHSRPLYTKKYNVVELETVNIKPFVVVLDELEKYVCHDQGYSNPKLKIRFVVKKNVPLMEIFVSLGEMKLILQSKPEHFKKFVCKKKDISVGVVFMDFYNAIKNCNYDDTLILTVYKKNVHDTGNYFLSIKSINLKNSSISRCYLNLSCVSRSSFKSSNLSIDASITMKSEMFNNMCQKMNAHKYYIKLRCYSNKVKFIDSSPLNITTYKMLPGNDNIQIEFSNKDNQPENIEVTCRVKNLLMFSKCLKFCDNVSFIIKCNNFMAVQYEMPTFGKLTIVIK